MMPLTAAGTGPVQGTAIVLMVEMAGSDDVLAPSWASSSCACSTICLNRSATWFALNVTRSRWRSTRSRSLPGNCWPAPLVVVFTQRCQDERLELGCGNTADRSGRMRFFLQHGLGDVIAVARAALICVGRAHAVAALIKKAAGQEGGRAPQPAAPRHRLIGKLALHRRKQRAIENGLVLAAVNLASVNHLADIEAVLEQMRERDHA